MYILPSYTITEKKIEKKKRKMLQARGLQELIGIVI
jgi:hypothetical protein